MFGLRTPAPGPEPALAPVATRRIPCVLSFEAVQVKAAEAVVTEKAAAIAMAARAHGRVIHAVISIKHNKNTHYKHCVYKNRFYSVKLCRLLGVR